MSYHTYQFPPSDEDCLSAELLIQYVAQPETLSKVELDAISNHFMACPKCLKLYGALSNVEQEFYQEQGRQTGADVPLPASDVMVESVRAKFWQSIADDETQQKQDYRRKFVYPIGKIAAAACLMVATFVGWYILKNQNASYESVHTVADQSRPRSNLIATRSFNKGDDLSALNWSNDGPAAISLAKLDYNTWRNENREWFSRKFPQIFKIQDVLMSKYGIHADYIELLMVSGDIWQFSYDPKNIAGQQVVELTSTSVERIARHYNIQADGLVAAISALGSSLLDSTKQPMMNVDANPSANLQKWGQEIVAALNSPKGIPSEMQISMLQTGTYLGKTRIATYLWVRDNRHTAMQLLATQYTATNLLNIGPGASVDVWLGRLETQSMASNQATWSGQQLTTMSVTNGCTVLPAEFRMQLVQALDVLMPKE